MYLQLAESAPKQRSTANNNPYIFIPNLKGRGPKGYYVREDYFDELTDREYDEFMNFLKPFQPAKGLSDKASRKRRKELRNDRRQSRNQLIDARAQAKREGKGMDWKSVVDSVGGIATGIFGGGAQGGAQLPPDGAAVPMAPEGGSFWDGSTLGISNKFFYPVAGVAVVGGIAYLAKRKKRRK